MLPMSDDVNGNTLMQLLYVLLFPLCFFGFTVLLRPAPMLSLIGAEDFVSRTAAASSEIMVSLILVRFVRRYVGGRIGHALWCVVEIFVMSLALALFVGLDVSIFARSLAYVSLILVLPYCTLYLSLSLKRSREEVSDKMRFYDEKGRLKIVLPSESVVYIQAEDNYVRVNYLDDGVSRTIAIRNSMKAIDDLCQYHGIWRAHRSYYLNPEHVTWMGRNENDEVYAILDVQDMPHIPVTKRYMGRFVEKLS